MEVHVIATETIKPSSPTPPHLRTFKISLLDQMNIDGHFPLMLFYSGACENTTKTSDHLKKSLAKTLTHYYPFAGRVKGNLSIDCDDTGASFIEANVSCKMSDILDQLESDQLEKLLPFKDNKLKLYTGGIMVVVQANYFSCGGVAISIYFKHVIADAFAGAIFVKRWAAIACDGSNRIEGAVYGCASIFPPQDLPLQRLWRKSFVNNVSLGDAITKRFIFDDTTIATLRETIVNGPCLNRPTRFEAVAALIWGAAIAAGREREDFKAKNVALIPVSLRHKINMASPEQCIGNVGQAAIAKWPTEKMIDYNSLAAKLHEAIMMMDENYARKLNEGGGFLNDLRELDEGIGDSNVFFLTSMFRSPLYEADFGWGKPKWANSVMNFNNFIFCSDTCSGGGIEAWVGLPKEDMQRFEKNPHIVAYASFKPSI